MASRCRPTKPNSRATRCSATAPRFCPITWRKRPAAASRPDRWQRLTLADLRAGEAGAWLAALHDNAVGVVDGEISRRLPDRSPTPCWRPPPPASASCSAAPPRCSPHWRRLPPQPVAAEAFATLVRDGRPGAVIVGSHVAKTTAQLTALLKERGVVGLPLDVARLPGATRRGGRRTDREHRPRPCTRPHPGGVHQPRERAVRQRGGTPGLRRGGVRHADGRGATAAGDAGLSHQQGRHHLQRRAVDRAGADRVARAGADPARRHRGADAARAPPAADCRWSSFPATSAATARWPKPTGGSRPRTRRRSPAKLAA